MEWNFRNVKEAPFEIGGILHPDKNYGEYYRMDASKKEIYSDPNRGLGHHTSGGTVRFITDADSICVRNKLREVTIGMNHFTHRGVWGLDMLVGSGTNRQYCGKMMQTFADSTELNENIVTLPAGENEVLIYMPLYAGIEDIEIGLPEGASLKAPSPRTFGPIAFYGSSITQGGCASRAGTAFHNIVCRHFDADCINLGFSGSAFGEQSIAEYLATKEVALFVMDYVYNSRSLEELETTHYPFYKTFRDAHPGVPVLMCTHPYCWETQELDIKRIEIVKATYDRAIAEGDKDVYFLDGREYFPAEMTDLCFVDYLHPNDLGMYFMAKKMIEEIEKIIK